jgi:hypothetical protein
VIIDESHQKWISSSAIVAVVTTVVYLLYAFLAANGPTGGSWPGLLFAVAGTALIIFECLLSLRKKYPASPLGRVQTWMRAHIWLGLLSFLLILMHAGFHWGRGLAWVLMWLFTIIMVSGIYGIAVQQYIPRRMAELVTQETSFEQIPDVIHMLRVDATERVELVTADLGPEVAADIRPAKGRAGGLKVNLKLEEDRRHKRKAAAQFPVEEAYTKFLSARYLQHVRPFLDPQPPAEVRQMFHDQAAISSYFQSLRRQMPKVTHPILQDLEAICEERRQLAVQERLHRWLHLWLYVHVPLSMVFLVLIAVHAVISLRY